MKKQQLMILSLLFLTASACGSLDGLSSDSLNDVSDESETETAVASLVETLSDSSSSGSSDSVSSSISSSAFRATTEGEEESEGEEEVEAEEAETENTLPRHRCSENSQISETFSCDEETGTASRAVTFEGCVIENNFFSFELNGSFTNTITGGGDGLCDNALENAINFQALALSTDPSHVHETGEEGLVRSFTTRRGDEATITSVSSRTTLLYDAVDADEDGLAEEVTQSVAESTTVTNVFGDETRSVEIFSTEEGFDALDTDGVTPITVETSLPVNLLTFDGTTGKIATRQILSGHHIVDRGDVRLVFTVGDEGLTFDETDDVCGPDSGTMEVTSYTLVDDAFVLGDTGSVTFADGSVESAELGGETLNVTQRPCK